MVLILLVCFGSSGYRRYNAYLAIDAIQNKAGFVRPTPKAQGWRRIFSNDVYKVHHLSFHSSFGVTDQDVAAITRLPWLRRLSLHNTAVTDKCAPYVAKLRHLEALSFEGTKFSDKGLAEISGLRKLKSLSLNRTPVTNAGMELLSGLTEMEVLLLNQTNVTSLEPFRNMVKLKRFELNNSGEGDTASLRYLQDKQRLETLHLNNMKATDAQFSYLRDLGRLKTLVMSRTFLHDGAAEIWQGYPQLEQLHIAVEGDFELLNHAQIRRLHVDGFPDSVSLHALPRLSHLYFKRHWFASGMKTVDRLIATDCPELQAVNLLHVNQTKIAGSPKLTNLYIGDHDSLELDDLDGIWQLQIGASLIDRALMEQVTNLENAVDLAITNPEVHYAPGGIELLTRFPNLTTLNLATGYHGHRRQPSRPRQAGQCVSSYRRNSKPTDAHSLE